MWNGVESKDEDTESKEKEYEYKQKEEKTGSDGKNSDEISLEELDGEGNEKLMKQGDEVKSKEKYRHRWHVSDVLRKIKVVQSDMKIVWQSVEESDTFICNLLGDNGGAFLIEESRAVTLGIFIFIL